VSVYVSSTIVSRYLRAETRVVHNKILQSARYFHKHRAKGVGNFPFSNLPEEKDFTPEIRADGIKHSVLLTGNPGIGKTVKIQHIIFVVLKQGEDVGLIIGTTHAVILSKDVSKCRVFAKLDDAVYLELSKLPLVLADSNNIEDTGYCMGLRDKMINTFLIIFQSPRKRAIAKYLKVSLVYYLSACTLEELIGMNTLLKKSKIASKVIKERYEKVGGAPRFVLGSDMDMKRRETDIVDAIAKHLQSDKNFNESLDEYSHALVDLKAKSPDFSEYVTKWRPYTFGKLNLEQKRNQILLLKNEVCKYIQNGNRCFAGAKFEELCGSILQVGARVRAGSIEDGKLKHNISMSFPGEMEIARRDWWPIERNVMATNYRDPNFPCVDFAILDDMTLYVFDVTVSEPTFKTMGDLGNVKTLVKYQGNIKHFADMIRRLGIMEIPGDVKLVYVYLVPNKSLEKVV